jgi:hypothetical protein
MSVLKFQYRVIQLSRIPWRRFVKSENPLASALMAKMKMSPKDRPRVKLECLRLLASLRLDPARKQLIGVFVDSYLKLNELEARQFARRIANLGPAERRATMELTTSWEEKGRAEGKEQMVLRMIGRRFGDVPAAVSDRIDRLSADKLDDLGVALFDFSSIADVDQWLAQQLVS